MKNHFVRCLLFFVLIHGLYSGCNSANQESAPPVATKKYDYALVIHGGAGTLSKDAITPELEQAYRDVLNESLSIGEDMLKVGGTSLDAVEAVIRNMENSPLFNAGKGAVFTHEGKNEMDASIMQGNGRKAGAISGVTNIKNPISTARMVMEKSKHVLLSGQGAEEFAKENGVEIVDPSYFYTERRWKSLQEAIKSETIELSESNVDNKFGTVGAVALDKNGNITAGTSTGGMTNKRYNRIGDSPIIGAGTFADNMTCGVSCTGHGEYFIRYEVAYDVSARMKYLGESVEAAAERVIHGDMKTDGGTGGLIALDKNGNIAMPFNTSGMYRGYARPGERMVQIYKDND